MAVDQALKKAIEATLAQARDQPDDFRRRYRRLIDLVVTGNYEDSDVRSVMEAIAVVLQPEDLADGS
ncbi:hypothetical protein RAD15_24355 [Bradyrhizobium sp. 14AA]